MPATFIETRQVPVGDLQKFPGNARKGDLRRIRASIRRHGQYRSLVVRQDNAGQLVILAGNNTFDGLTAEHYETARCEIVTCTDGEAHEINVKDNRLGDLATYDDKALLAQLTGLDDETWLDAAGYTADDVDELQRITGAFGDEASGFLNPFTDPFPPGPPEWPQPGPAGTGQPGTVPPPPLPGGTPGPPPGGDPDDEDQPPPGPPPGTGQPPVPPPAQDFVQVAWVVTPGSRDTIRQAITLAQQHGDLGTSAEALHTIAAHYLATCQ